MRDLAEKIGVVTGGASGIGLGIARSLAAEGMAVVIADVETAAGEAAARALREGGGRALFVETDVADRASVEALAERAFSEFGGVHVVCNNAGVCVGTSMTEASEDEWRWLLSVNLDGVIHGVQAFVPRLIEQGQGGHVVNTASMGGLIASAWLGIYSVTKYAVVGLSESLRDELAPRGIGVSALCPGFVRTNLLSSDRNRPEQLGSGPTHLEFLKEGIEAGVAPDRVGALVVDGIRNDAAYIFTEPALRAAFEQRVARIYADFERIPD